MSLVVGDFRVLALTANDLSGGLVAEATAKACRYSRGAADVRRKTQHAGRRSYQRCAATGRTARNSAQIVRVVRSARHVIVGVKPKSSGSK